MDARSDKDSKTLFTERMSVMQLAKFVDKAMECCYKCMQQSVRKDKFFPQWSWMKISEIAFFHVDDISGPFFREHLALKASL